MSHFFESFNKIQQTSHVGLLVCFGILGCGPKETVEVVKQPRPITVLKLESVQPESETRYTGSVSAWKVEDIGFEVGGRINSIAESGSDIKGPEEVGDEVLPGDSIASLDEARYKIQLSAAEARVKTATAQRNAVQNDLEKILPQQIVAAEVDLKLGTAEYNRQKDLFDQNAGTQTELDQALAGRDNAQAMLDQLIQSQDVKKADLESYESQIQEAQQAVGQANQDLSDTTLEAPFSGRIAQSYKTLGSVVQQGEAVVQLQMMNPIQVNVEVDSKTDSRLNFGDFVYAYPPDSPSQPIKAMVYETASVADPSTRTFLIQLLVMNEKMTTGLPEEFDPEQDLRTRQLTGAFQEFADASLPYYLNVNSLHKDAQGDFIFRLKDFTWKDRIGSDQTEFEVEKVYVSLGDEILRIFDVATFRQLKELGEINPEDDLFVGKLLSVNGQEIPSDTAVARLEENGKIFWVRERWQLRPGDFLDVELGEQPLIEGFYVPMDAIVKRTGSNKSSVFVLQDPGGKATVQEVFVNVFPSIQSDKLTRITPQKEGTLKEGSLIVSKGSHYLSDGETVRLTNLLEVTE
ncbi:HlyD family efflux transporter periplasmic adaptor subunit [Planctomicrobium sp.]|nr:HlyD family efflux transporter periplasmic adaptor subunit [Planctomicrobium sp.]MDB4439535.1 HlyD family efflux transporter periplasmic adaptor subunit [Planctomicrobium sp.]MDB4731240.1 HlyD family efflux transporter periplasmic adaptor subunit [bacterium]MDB4733293.1 HlyD family efflux transporter periplasmic adaptor subunit [Planctomicrobium sp.]